MLRSVFFYSLPLFVLKLYGQGQVDVGYVIGSKFLVFHTVFCFSSEGFPENIFKKNNNHNDYPKHTSRILKNRYCL